ncbi:16S rRNA (cytosine(1402)-N(4))-methyltransferase RsmH [candidate division WOR-3 bacterium]|nr:16S rRNA (cytosine(1402)-N(4))-methyltransferase RsmH [candidate division WOR-3 bacterium]
MPYRMRVFHHPVMLREVLEYLCPARGFIIDACVGGSGHARPILGKLWEESAAQGGNVAAGNPLPRHGEGLGRRPFGLLGIDLDPDALAAARRQLDGLGNWELVHASYAELPAIVRQLKLAPVTGVLFDFGASLHQLTSPRRGFGIGADGPIDMRFDQTSGAPAALDLILRSSEENLRQWFRVLGQEPMSGRIARAVYENRRRLRTTGDLARTVRGAVPVRHARKALVRVFQAIRMATNHELDNIRRGLAGALEVLAPAGRLVSLSYHSLEDREVKLCLRDGQAEGKLRILTRKPVRPSADEVRLNRSSRSARLRAAEAVA